jgi:hypothetical protein
MNWLLAARAVHQAAIARGLETGNGSDSFSAAAETLVTIWLTRERQARDSSFRQRHPAFPLRNGSSLSSARIRQIGRRVVNIALADSRVLQKQLATQINTPGRITTYADDEVK